MRNDSGRIPVEIIEIDQDFCQHTYGESPCNAVLGVTGERKCFNTIGTCQDLVSYSAEPLTLRFCTGQQDLPLGEYYYPFLQSVRTQPAEINPGGGDQGRSLMGRRGTVTAVMSDHIATDSYTDKYYQQRITGAAQADGVGYNPVDHSTFWRRWRARNMYYLHRPMRYVTGYLRGGALVDTVTRHYVITGFSGPDQRGSVSIQGTDILTLAQRQKAQMPLPSEGKLLADIDEEATSFSMVPTDVGESYPASGYVRLGAEVMAFTRSGDMLSVTRGEFSSEIESHSDGDTVQLCLDVSGQPHQILQTLLHDGAGIPLSFLDLPQWADEAVGRGYLNSNYSALITEPTNVEELLNEIFEEMYFFCWYDERDAKIRIMAVRPSDGDPEPVTVNNNDNFIFESVRVDNKSDEIITRVVVNYGMRNPAENRDDATNYRVTDAVVDLLEEGEDRSRASKTRTINSRWLSRFAGGEAMAMGRRLLDRYRVPPVRVSFQMDAKDRDLWLADFVRISCPQIVDDTGREVLSDAQIISVAESVPGTTFAYTAEIATFATLPDPGYQEIFISDDGALNLRAIYDDVQGGVAPDGRHIVFVVRAGVVATGSSAITTGDWPVSTRLGLRLEAGAYGVGAGGVGGDGGTEVSPNATAGSNGGVGLRATRPIDVDNLGVMGGGGGGGGGGGHSPIPTPPGCGGGGGASFGEGGEGGEPGEPGGLELGGEGGNTDAGETGRGGDGGDLGEPGEAGGDGSAGSGAPGGLAGAAVIGVSYVTYINRGDVRGAEVD